MGRKFNLPERYADSIDVNKSIATRKIKNVMSPDTKMENLEINVPETTLAGTTTTTLRLNQLSSDAINESPRVSSSSINTTTPAKSHKLRNNLLLQLESNLSPKYISINSTNNGKQSRYGRQHKYREFEGFLPIDVLYGTPRRIKKEPQSPDTTVEEKIVTTNISNALSKTPIKHRSLSQTSKCLLTQLDTTDRKVIKSNVSDDIEDTSLISTMTNNTHSNLKENNIPNNYCSMTMKECLSMDIKSELAELHLEPKATKMSLNKSATENNSEIDKTSEFSTTLDVLPPVEATQVEHVEQYSDLSTFLEPELRFDRQQQQHGKEQSPCEKDSAIGSSINGIDINEKWFVGDLVWCRFGSYPYWPCIICIDRFSGIHSKKTKSFTQIFVCFFGDKGRANWVYDYTLMEFHGHEAFMNLQCEALTMYKKYDRRYKMYYVGQSSQKQWLQAVIEAEKAWRLNVDQRFDYLEILLARNAKSSKGQKFTNLSVDSLSNIDSTPDLEFIPIADGNNQEHKFPELPINIDKKNDIKKYILSVSQYSQDSPDTILSNFNQNIQNYEQYITLKLMDIDRNHIKKEKKRKKHGITRHEQVVKKSHIKTLRQRALSIKKVEKEENSLKVRQQQSKRFEMNELKKEQRLKKKLEKDEKIRMEYESYATKQYNSNYLFKNLPKTSNVCRICLKIDEHVFKCTGDCNYHYHLSCARLCFKKWRVIAPENASKNDTSLIKINSKIIKILDDSDIEIMDEKLMAVRTPTMPLTSAKKLKISKTFMCSLCETKSPPICYVCFNGTNNNNNYNDNHPNINMHNDLLKCTYKSCTYYFHRNCLKYWPQSKMSLDINKEIFNMQCPLHTCHTCVADDPKGKFYPVHSKTNVKCIICPAVYHRNSFCIPAGSRLLTLNYLICPRHKDERKQINGHWCFLCSKGGTLICCDTCPTAGHASCLKLNDTPDSFICEDCETGRLPLYGEIVWAKLGGYRWWPSIIVPPHVIPKAILDAKHKCNDFCVRFFGSNNYYWVGRSFVFLFNIDDLGERRIINKWDAQLNTAVQKAKEMFEYLKVANDKWDSFEKYQLKPQPYQHIYKNRAVPPIKIIENTEQIYPCQCNPNDPEPCGTNSGCINRILVTECNVESCPAGVRCQNQMFTKGISPKTKLKFIVGKGFGLITLEHIPMGTFILEYVGEVINHEEFNKRLLHKEMEKDEHYYFFTLNRLEIIDAGPMGNTARFINHSCTPNCIMQKWRVNGCDRLGLFAIDDISTETELTFNYNLECIGEEKKICHCGSIKCSGFIGVKVKDEMTTKKRYKRVKKVKRSQTNNNNNNDTNNMALINNFSTVENVFVIVDENDENNVHIKNENNILYETPAIPVTNDTESIIKNEKSFKVPVTTTPNTKPMVRRMTINSIRSRNELMDYFGNSTSSAFSKTPIKNDSNLFMNMTIDKTNTISIKYENDILPQTIKPILNYANSKLKRKTYENLTPAAIQDSSSSSSLISNSTTKRRKLQTNKTNEEISVEIINIIDN